MTFEMEEKRFIEIETKLAHQEVLLEELNKVIYQQQKTIDVLESKILILSQRMKDVSSGGGGAGEIGSGNEKPPHY